jgi:hypothetical protein
MIFNNINKVVFEVSKVEKLRTNQISNIASANLMKGMFSIFHTFAIRNK